MNPAIPLLAPILLVASSAGAGWVASEELRPSQPDLSVAHQVRIEQHVTIRITPRPAPGALGPLGFDDDLDSDGGGRFIERKAGKCLPIGAIAGTQPVASRKILLIMRDQRVFTAELKKGCNSRDYYSGFIVARNSDGMICTGRDELQARNGASCQVHGFKQVVPVGN